METSWENSVWFTIAIITPSVSIRVTFWSFLIPLSLVPETTMMTTMDEFSQLPNCLLRRVCAKDSHISVGRECFFCNLPKLFDLPNLEFYLQRKILLNFCESPSQRWYFWLNNGCLEKNILLTNIKSLFIRM